MFLRKTRLVESVTSLKQTIKSKVIFVDKSNSISNDSKIWVVIEDFVTDVDSRLVASVPERMLGHVVDLVERWLVRNARSELVGL